MFTKDLASRAHFLPWLMKTVSSPCWCNEETDVFPCSSFGPHCIFSWKLSEERLRQSLRPYGLFLRTHELSGTERADNVLNGEGKWTVILGTTLSFIDLWNIFIQVKRCHEGTRLFAKNMPFGSKTNCLILSTNFIINGWDHFVNRCLFVASWWDHRRGVCWETPFRNIFYAKWRKGNIHSNPLKFSCAWRVAWSLANTDLGVSLAVPTWAARATFHDGLH
jgi:hypothetical protein